MNFIDSHGGTLHDLFGFAQNFAKIAAHRLAARRAEGVTGPLPADLVTASGSGLDPDLSPEAALVQVPRVARVRGLTTARVRALVEAAIARPLLGDPHVNVLALNRALDAAGGR